MGGGGVGGRGGVVYVSDKHIVQSSGTDTEALDRGGGVSMWQFDLRKMSILHVFSFNQP